MRFVFVYRKLGIDVNSFYLKRNANIDTPQLKNDSETLRELGIVSGSILHVTLGTPLAADEYLLKVLSHSGPGWAFYESIVCAFTKRLITGAACFHACGSASPVCTHCYQRTGANTVDDQCIFTALMLLRYVVVVLYFVILFVQACRCGVCSGVQVRRQCEGTICVFAQHCSV